MGYHAVGDRDMIPVVGTAGDTLNVGEIEFVQLDLWIDRADGIVQVTFVFQNESQMVKVTISKGEDGMAVVQFAATPS